MRMRTLALAVLLAVMVFVAGSVADAADTRASIRQHAFTAIGDLYAVNGEASAFHVQAAQAALGAAQQEIDALRTDLANLTQTTDCANPATPLQVLAFPSPLLATQGKPFSFQLVVCGGTPPYKFTGSGNLPADITMTASGLLTTGTSTVRAFPDAYCCWYPFLQDSAGGQYVFSLWVRVVSP